MERDYSYIDTKKSIIIKKLYFKDSVLNIINAGIIVVGFSFIAGCFMFSICRNIKNDSMEHYVYLIFKIIGALICMYIVYRKLTEKKLFSIKTKLSKNEARRIIDKYFERLRYKSWNSTTDMASYSDNSTFLGVYNYFILPLDNEILFTVIKDQERLPLPAIITLWTTYGDLKRLLNEK